MRISIGRYFRLELDPARSPHGLVLELDETLTRIEGRAAKAALAKAASTTKSTTTQRTASASR